LEDAARLLDDERERAALIVAINIGYHLDLPERRPRRPSISGATLHPSRIGLASETGRLS